ncbi:MAG TPA: AarF/UbiB family protein, partial [Limnochordia bacterium]
MRLPWAGRRVEHLRRYRRVIEVFLRHGFGYLVEQLDLAHYLPLGRRIFGRRSTGASLAVGQRLRAALAELGPTYVKLGQLLSTRADLIPPDILSELQHLQDDVPPVPFEAVRRVLERELKKPLSEAFTAFASEPVAAASIGQVHEAVLPGGEPVVVKVQRPGIGRIIELDMEILFQLARLAQERLRPELFSPVTLVEEFATTLRRELDYRIEARYAERFREN